MVRYLAAYVALGVGVIQIGVAMQFGLTPWKGGGFGMFGNVDSPTQRAVRVSIVDAHGLRHRVRLPLGRSSATPFLDYSMRRLLAFPNHSDLLELAHAVSRLPLCLAPGAAPMSPELSRSSYGPALFAGLDDDAASFVEAREPSVSESVVEVRKVTASVVGLKSESRSEVLIRVIASVDYSLQSAPQAPVR